MNPLVPTEEFAYLDDNPYLDDDPPLPTHALSPPEEVAKKTGTVAQLSIGDNRSYFAPPQCAFEQGDSPTPDEVPVDKTPKVPREGDGDIGEGLVTSRISLAFATGLAVAGVAFCFSPPGWIIAASAVGAFALTMLAQISVDGGLQKVSFECTAIIRMCETTNHNEIVVNGKETGVLLGAIPNRLIGYLESLKGVICAVLSINEPWERKPFGLSNPYRGKDIRNMGIDYKKIDALDHEYLTFAQLDEAANYIHQQLTENPGKKIYVHCRAGNGRSGMAVAAYLIKYLGLSAEDAVKCILESRPSATGYKKLDDKIKDGKRIHGLRSYAHMQRYLESHPDNPPIPLARTVLT